MKREEFNSLPDFIWVRNPHGLIIEVRKDSVFDFINGKYELKRDFSITAEQSKSIEKGKTVLVKPPEKDYLNVEEL